MQPNYSGIPAELKERPQWVGWRFEQRDDRPKPTKVPIDPGTGFHASSTDPATWGTFEHAKESLARYDLDGIGFVFATDDPYAGVDLDECRNAQTGEIEQWAHAIINWLRGYTEVSPSGKGVHVILKAKLPPGGHNKRIDTGQAIEMYDRGRFFTVTGNKLII